MMHNGVWRNVTGKMTASQRIVAAGRLKPYIILAGKNHET
jgi:hypothetical protein